MNDYKVRKYDKRRIRIKMIKREGYKKSHAHYKEMSKEELILEIRQLQIGLLNLLEYEEKMNIEEINKIIAENKCNIDTNLDKDLKSSELELEEIKAQHNLQFKLFEQARQHTLNKNI